MKKPDEVGLPPRLIEGDGATADLLRRFSRPSSHPTEESRAWDRTLTRLARAPSVQRVRLGIAAACGALVTVAVLYLVLAPRPGRVVVEAHDGSGASASASPSATVSSSAVVVPAVPPTLPRAAAPVTATGAEAGLSSRPANESPRIELAQAPVGLPVGPADLVGEARVTLSPGGAARASASAGDVHIILARGQIALDVQKRRPGQLRTFEVVAGEYRFVGLGGVLQVARTSHAIALNVSNGRVGVYRGSVFVAAVGAGGRWTSPPAPSSAAVPAVQSPAVQSDVDRRGSCGALASENPRQGIACYLGEASGSDLRAEVALYEIARLRRDALGEPAAAFDTLRAHQSRFPSGKLRAEVDLSIAELLPKLGRYREALTAADALLREHPAGERVAELQLLRGHVLREGFGDWAAAERAYARAAGSDDPRAGDPAAYWQAVCLDRLARMDDARLAYRRYLSRPHPARVADAKRRLEQLEREH